LILFFRDIIKISPQIITIISQQIDRSQS